jgi:hypothetical protein
MILLITLVGFYVNRISHFFTEHFGRASYPQEGVQSDAAHPSDSDSDSDDPDITTRSDRRRRRPPESTEPSRPPRNMPRITSEANTVDTLDLPWARNPEYAPLFGRWHFHEKVPLLRALWEYHLYYNAPKKKKSGGGSGGSRPSTSTTSSSRHTREDGGRRRAARSTTTSSWGGETDDFWSDNVERDYALHRARALAWRFVGDRILRPMGKLVPAAWRGKSRNEGGGDEEEGYQSSGYGSGGGDGDEIVVVEAGYTIRPSMQRSSGSGSLDNWSVPSGLPIRRRRAHERERRGSTSFVGGFVAKQWRETVGSFGARRHAPTVSTTSSGSGGGSFPTIVGVAFASDDDESAEGRARGRKGVKFPLTLLPFFGKRKVKVDDLESNRGSEE